MRSAVVLWSTMVIYFIGMFIAAVSIHRNRGMEEELSISQMVTTPFVVFLITNAYYIFFFYWIMNVFDPELLKLHQELTHQEMLDFYKNTEFISEVRKNELSDYTPTFGASVKQYIKSIIGGFILSFIIGIVVRRT